MHVCANCAQASAELVFLRGVNARLRREVEALVREVVDGQEAFWELAGDVRLHPVHVTVADALVHLVSAPDEAEAKEVEDVR